jgi:hypothetical protein
MLILVAAAVPATAQVADGAGPVSPAILDTNLARPVNQKDYAIRMAEYFDHYLKGAPAPDWLKNGIPRLKMEEELPARRDSLVKAAEAPPASTGGGVR